MFLPLFLHLVRNKIDDWILNEIAVKASDLLTLFMYETCYIVGSVLFCGRELLENR